MTDFETERDVSPVHSHEADAALAPVLSVRNADSEANNDMSRSNVSRGSRPSDRSSTAEIYRVSDPNSAAASSKKTEHIEEEPRRSAWTASFARFGPLSGLAALLFSLLSLPACYAILRSSIDQPVTNWKYRPSVYLAVLAALSNKAMAYAALQGAVVFWWRKALRGTTYDAMHQDWKMIMGFWDSLIAGKKMNILAVACICTALTAADGPLLQGASDIKPKIIETPLDLTARIAPEVPTNYTGIYIPGSSSVTNYFGSPYTFSSESPYSLWAPFFSDEFVPIFASWIKNETLAGAVSGCPGTCRVKVEAPALHVSSCNSTIYSMLGAHDNQTEAYPHFRNGSSVFEVAMGVQPTRRETFVLRTGISNRAQSSGCQSTFNITSCYMQSAIGEYPLIIRGQNISFDGSISSPRILRLANNSEVRADRFIRRTPSTYAMQTVPTTLSGIAWAGVMQHAMYLPFLNDTNDFNGPLTMPQMGFTPSMIDQISHYQTSWQPNVCADFWRDPRNDLMASMNQLMFMTGMSVARTTNESYLATHLDESVAALQEVKGVRVETENVFTVKYWYFVGSVAVELMSILTILVTFYGWWKLGRAVTFAPLEMAKAFEAPLLGQASSNGDADAIAKRYGDQALRYGAVGTLTDIGGGVVEYKAEKLAFAKPELVYAPMDTFHLQS